MKKDFLPKTLNSIPWKRACAHINVGRMSTELHYHDCVEIISVRRGTVSIFFDSGWHTLSRGELIFVPPGCIHRCVSEDDTAEQAVIGFTVELICGDMGSDSSILCPYLTGCITTGCILSGDDCVDLQAIADRLADSKDTTEPCAYIALCADVLSLYGQILAVWKKRGILRELPTASPLVSKIREYVSGNFASGISACEFAQQLHISYSYLAKIMTGTFGMSFGKYIIACRIENAKKQLLSTQSSIAEIGSACGFASSSAFISHFKALTGKTPLAFRKEAYKRFSD